MVKKLTKHGNSYALVLDRALLELLKIDPETPLDLSINGRQLVIQPASSAVRGDEFTQALDEVNKEFGSVLKKLAK